jgi:hypothetical protein
LLNLRGRTTAIVSRIIMKAALAGLRYHYAIGSSMPHGLFRPLIPKKSRR